MRLLWLAVAMWMGLDCAFARVGTVRTLSGESFDGRIRVTPERIFVVNAGRSLIRSVEWTNVARIIFPRPARVPPTDIELAAVAAEWKETDIGPIFTTGSTRFEPGSFTVRSSGLNVGGESDSFHFVYKPVQGDSEIVAEVGSIQYTHPNATAGLMMRENLGEYSPNILIGLTAMRGGLLQWRQNERQETLVTPFPRVFAPYWLKLKRRGSEFSAYLSPNGRLWFLVGKMSAAMAENIYVGLAVTSAREGMLNWTTFNKVRESRKVVNEDFTPEVELVSGSVLSGRPERMDAEELVFSGAPKVLRVPTDRVARIVYQPLLGELTWRTRSGRPGVWVSNGDFFDGDLRSLEGDKISISSVLYGLRTFDVDEDVLAVALNPASQRKAEFEIETVGGDRLLASEVALGEGEFRLREAAVGEVRVPAFEVSELRRR